MMVERIAYKCIPKGMYSHGHEWKVGEWYKHDGNLKLCPTYDDAKSGVGGFHASKLLPDAFYYVDPFYVCKVAYRGDIIEGRDKFVAREMKIISAYKWSKRDSVTFCVSLKERMCKINTDERVRDAFEAAEAYLKNPCKKTKEAAHAASDGASNAARSARAASYSAWGESCAAIAAAWAASYSAWAAGVASWAAAGYAAGHAASYAARSARAASYSAWAASDAGRDAEKKKQHKTILKIIKKS